jgi:hypothetical protein
LVARQCGPAAPRKQGKAIAQPRGKALDTECIDTSRRKLDCQISSTAGTSASAMSKPSALAMARSTNSWTAEYCNASSALRSAACGGSSSEWRRCNHSPSARSGSRLVARMQTRGAAFNTASASDAAALITCSQLSSTISARLSRSQAVNPDTRFPPEGEMPSTVIRALGTRFGPGNEESPTNQTPSG